MAIEKVIFTASGNDRATQIATWLQANAIEYFDTIELQENGYEVNCNIDNVNVLTIEVARPSISAICYITLMNGTSQQTRCKENIIGAYKTSKGICLYMGTARNTSVTEPSTGETCSEYSGGRDLFICKSDRGNTSFAFNVDTQSSSASDSGRGNIYTADVAADSQFSKWFPSDNSTYENAIAKRPFTVLAPVPLGDGGTVAEGVYFTPFSQYKGINTPIMLSVNSKNYIYDGAFALEE